MQGQTKHAVLQGVVANGVDSLGKLTVTENASTSPLLPVYLFVVLN